MLRAPTRSALAALSAVAVALSRPAAAAPDSFVAGMAAEVRRAEIESSIRTLEGFGTRYAFTAGCDAAGDWLLATLGSYGLEVTAEDFVWSGKTMRNVVARKPGALHPERVWLVGAHYDSTSEDPFNLAPGADDNASGVAVVLAAARVLSAYDFEDSIELVCFSGEEQGLRGSRANAASARSQGKDLRGVINLDMVGYWPLSHDRELDIGKDTASASLAEAMEQATRDYTTLAVHNWPDTGMCHDDHAAYWAEGFAAIGLMDCLEAHDDPVGSGESTPHYHRSSDRIGTLDLDRTTEVARATVAATATLAAPVMAPITLFAVADRGSGDVVLSWSGGAINYDVDGSLSKDFGTGVTRLTPAVGIPELEWRHAGVLADGTPWFYHLTRH